MNKFAALSCLIFSLFPVRTFAILRYPALSCAFLAIHGDVQLVGRGFVQYLLGVLSGDIRPDTTDFRRNAVAWEGKHVSDRGEEWSGVAG